MAIMDYNKSNPFVIKLENDRQQIETKLLSFAKYVVIISLIMVPNLLFDLYAFTKAGLAGEPQNYILVAFNLGYLVVVFILFLAITRSLSIKAIRNIIYGDDYKDIYVNSEKIWELSSKISKLNGFIDGTRLCFKYFNIISVVINLIYIIGLIIGKGR